MKINTSIFILVILFTCLPVNSQNPAYNSVTAENAVVKKEGDRILISMNLKFDHIDLGSQEMMYITPVVVSGDSVRLHTFSPILVIGSKRNKALNRALDFGKNSFKHTPQLTVYHHKKNNRAYPLTLQLDYQYWIHNSRLMFYCDVTGCACENEYTSRYTVLDPILPATYVPRYEVSYITPPREDVKRRSETYSAHINFEVARYEILHNYKNNAQVLEEVDRIITEIRNDENLTVTEFRITGYASPEGSSSHNMTLSRNRAESFVAYLIARYSLDTSSVKTQWKGEDWEGLYKIIDQSFLADKQRVLEIIDTEPDPDVRERKLKQLNGGETYHTLLRDYYPPLRRNDYTISYISKPFDIEEAKRIIRTKPQHLSLNEMYLVANTYPRNSREFREILTTIDQYYPDDIHARLNSAAYELEFGDPNKAIARLKNIDLPQAWNNLGIAYYKKKDYQMARNYFDRAAQAGLSSASHNANELIKSGLLDM